MIFYFRSNMKIISMWHGLQIRASVGIGTIKLTIREKGIRWHYRKKFLKFEKGYITYEELRKKNELILPGCP